MATRTKTLEYFLMTQETASINSASVYTFPNPPLLYIAETGSRVFRSCFAEVFWRDVASGPTANRGSVATQSLFFQLGNNPYYTSSMLRELTDTGEHTSWVGGFDLTEYFSSSFGNLISQSCNCQYQYFIQTPSTQSYEIRGLATTLYITYTYNDTATSIRSKTAVIPLGLTGSINSPSLHKLIDYIPALDTYCTESNKTFDAIWVEIEGSQGLNTTATHSSSFTIDAGPRTASFVTLNPQNSNTWNKYYLPLTHIDTSVSHSFNGALSEGNCTNNSNAVTLKATYRYNHDNSNYILNTPLYAMKDIILYAAYNSEGARNLDSFVDINIQEPAPITQKNCAVRVFTSLNATLALSVKQSNGGLYNWVVPFGTSDTSGQMAQFRMDDKLIPFSSSNIQRGSNRIEFGYYTIDLQRLGSIGTGVVLNYISGKDPRGDGVHTHTITELAVSHSATQNYLPAYDGTNNLYGRELLNGLSIYDSDYYIENYFIDSYSWVASGTNNNLGLRQVITLENVGDNNIYPSGSIQSQAYLPQGDSEGGIQKYYYAFPDYFTKYPQSFYRKNPLQTSLIRYLRSSAVRNHLRHVTTYHGISYTVTGSISGYAGDGSGIYVDCIESGSNGDNSGKIFQTITSTGGQFSGSVYDNTKQYYVTARQSSLLVSRSDDATGSVIVI